MESYVFLVLRTAPDTAVAKEFVAKGFVVKVFVVKVFVAKGSKAGYGVSREGRSGL